MCTHFSAFFQQLREKQAVERATKEAKIIRSKKQRSRRGKTAQLESVEEDSYMTGIALEPASFIPQLRAEYKGTRIYYTGMPFKNSPKLAIADLKHVYFDLETSGIFLLNFLSLNDVFKFLFKFIEWIIIILNFIS